MKRKTPQTNGMAAHFNGRLSQLLLNSAEDLEKTQHWAVQPLLAAKGTGTCCPSASAQNLEDKSAVVICNKRAQSSVT
ncbi:hypothetical protein [Comamonas sp. C11]|uniref:hypothetical protein n=1 Tax=Comamonas sp. C11 TaxID=2966554 RepID=UPI0021134F7C|nr:hypothetical protein [Comamonas sp. C11]UUC94450.1 hypothetical protein NOX35_03695 [Comamonas sp. C11]